MPNDQTKNFIEGFSIEVTPKIFAKNVNLIKGLPKDTRVYIAHIEGSNTDEIINTAKEIAYLDLIPVPHIAARQINNNSSLSDLISAYKDVSGVSEILLIAGSNKNAIGEFESSIELIKTGLFDSGFNKIYFAGHPEGNKDIEASKIGLKESLSLKKDFSQITDAEIILTTQFCFDAHKVVDWSNNLLKNGIDLPIHIGVAGPTKLTTLLKYSIDCGVGPSIKILENNYSNVGKLLTSYSPTNFLDDLSSKTLANPNTNIQKVHFYPFGGIKELLNTYK